MKYLSDKHNVPNLPRKCKQLASAAAVRESLIRSLLYYKASLAKKIIVIVMAAVMESKLNDIDNDNCYRIT